MNTHARSIIVLALLLTFDASIAGAAQHAAMPPGMTHEDHMSQMRKEDDLKKRGAAAMGFDQDKVTHHFRVTTQGGVIQVDVRDPSDHTNREAIRLHLRQIAAAFAEGNFETPFATHAEVPPGVAALQRLTTMVTYSFEETTTGGRVRIVTTNREALAAIHVFLRYQIQEHRTGDPLTVK
ncbi:MAG TPA: hypothetical protein VEK56_06620 [Vicinamibacterales bacterium]|nr:hypothetical protein [Vicinamibacterales bacterium]